jgi:hypothetical protein
VKVSGTSSTPTSTRSSWEIMRSPISHRFRVIGPEPSCSRFIASDAISSVERVVSYTQGSFLTVWVPGPGSGPGVVGWEINRAATFTRGNRLSSLPKNWSPATLDSRYCRAIRWTVEGGPRPRQFVRSSPLEQVRTGPFSQSAMDRGAIADRERTLCFPFDSPAGGLPIVRTVHSPRPAFPFRSWRDF